MHKLTIRITDYQRLCLDELSERYQTTYGQLVRAIITKFLTDNEDKVDEAITYNQKKQNADNQ